MIVKDKMLKLAEREVDNAPNEDWENRGSLSIAGELRIKDIKSHDDKKLGEATVAFIKFEHPQTDNITDTGFDENRFAFIGFTLAAMKVGRKTITATNPVIGKIQEEDYEFNDLVSRFCPKCHSLDSVKSKSRVIGPECIAVTYKCTKCSYIDHDVID